MKKYLFLFLVIAGLGFIACLSTPQGDGKTFGAGVSNQAAAAEFTDVMEKLNSNDSIM